MPFSRTFLRALKRATAATRLHMAPRSVLALSLCACKLVAFVVPRLGATWFLKKSLSAGVGPSPYYIYNAWRLLPVLLAAPTRARRPLRFHDLDAICLVYFFSSCACKVYRLPGTCFFIAWGQLFDLGSMISILYIWCTFSFFFLCLQGLSITFFSSLRGNCLI